MFPDRVSSLTDPLIRYISCCPVYYFLVPRSTPQLIDYGHALHLPWLPRGEGCSLHVVNPGFPETGSRPVSVQSCHCRFAPCRRDVRSISVQCATLRSGIRDDCYAPELDTCAVVIGRQLVIVGVLVILFDIETQIGGMGKLRAPP